MGSKLCLKIASSLLTASLILCWTYTIIPGGNGSEAAAAPSNILTITTYAGYNEGHLITFPDLTTMSIDCAYGNITTLSHFHSDHCSGSQQYNRNNVSLGQVLYSDPQNDVTVTVVATNGRKIGDEDGSCTSSDENACSMVLWVKYKGFDYLSGGDLTGSKEGPLGDALAARGVDIDVYKVHHHGSSGSSYSGFLGDILPEYAVVSGHASSLKDDTFARLKSAGVNIVYDTYNDQPGDPQFKYSGGNITISTNGYTYSFSAPNFNDGPFLVDEYSPPEVIPPHLIITEVAVGAYRAPENHDWVELYLPPDASPVNLGSLYWTDLDEVQRAATSTMTVMPGDVVIIHDTVGTSESNATGKGENKWWDIYVENPFSQTWNAEDEQFVICSQNSIIPDPPNMIDAVVWSNDDGTMYTARAEEGNYLISTYQWGDPTSGFGSFSTVNEGPAIGDIDSGYAQRRTTEDTNSVRDWMMSLTHSQGTPPPTPTPTPTPPPAIKVMLNSSNPSEGDELSVGVIVQPIPRTPFDAYAVITGKAGTFSIQSGNRLRLGVAPLATNVRALPMGYTGVLLPMIIPKGVAGDYKVIAGLVDTGRTVRSLSDAFTYDNVTLTVR